MPELAAAYTVGFLFSLLLGALFIFLWSRYRDRPELALVNANLHGIGLYWSESRDRLLPWQQEDEIAERSKSRSQLLLTCLMLAFLSWAGFLFILVLMVSYRFLARSRLEKRLLASELATAATLSPDRVKALVAEISTDI